MELFKLLGTIAIDNSGANDAIDDTTDKAEKSESKMSSVFGKIGSAAVTMGKVVATGYLAVSAGINALAKEAISGYADYEQLVGGVETLFGAGGQSIEEYAKTVGKAVDDVRDEYNALMKAQKTVLSNADKAYKTAGMSANDYMETVTSFSASLIQSLGGDTEAAAEKANQAIIDMSDNANKMGTDMSMIQNAYQGFAKQNYTMLDNLKLGYGGTQEEMKRLLADAEALSGIKYDISSYADIVDAIHVIQKEMGIAGTTAKEASSTITGSVESAKSAWKNLLAGLGKDNADLADLTNQFVDSVITAAENILPRFKVIKDNITKVAEDLFGKAFDYVSIGILNTGLSFETVAKKVRSTIASIKDGALAMLQGAIEWFKTDGIEVIKTIWDTVQSGIDAAYPIIKGVFDWIVTNGVPILEMLRVKIQEWWGMVAPVIEEVVTKTASLVSEIIGVVVELFNDLVAKFGGVEAMFSKLSGVVSDFYANYLSNLIDTFRMLVEIFETVLLPILRVVIGVVIELAQSIAVNIMPAVQNIISKFFELASSIRTAVTEHILPLVQSFIAMIEELWLENKDKIELIGELFGAVADWISQQITKIVDGFQKYLMPVIKWVADTVRENMDKIKAVIQAAIDIVSGIIKIFIALFKGDWEGLWTAVKDTLKAGYDFIVARFEMIKKFLSDILSVIREACAKKWQEIVNDWKNKVTEAKETISSVFDSIKYKIDTVMENIKSKVKDVIEKVKGFFNFEVSLPHIKLPHFSIQPSGWKIGDLLQGSIPSLGIDWYAKGGVMTEPTVFGVNGDRVMAGGEAGAEAIAPIDVLQGYVAQAVAGQNAALVAILNKILDAILALDENMGGNLREALEGTSLDINHREFARLVKAVN